MRRTMCAAPLPRVFPRVTTGLVVLVMMASLLACAPSVAVYSSRPTATATPAFTSVPTNRYVDAKLGFSIELPGVGWSASPEPGLQDAPHISAVTLLGDEQTSHQQVVIGVFESSAMPAAFAVRGTATTHIGPYPAFADDRMQGLARDPCLVRIFLAHDDYVMATWCSADAAAHTTEFEQLLATYLPAAPGFVSDPQPAPAPEDCDAVKATLGYNSGATGWGSILATPTRLAPAGGWYSCRQPPIYAAILAPLISTSFSAPNWSIAFSMSNGHCLTYQATPHATSTTTRMGSCIPVSYAICLPAHISCPATPARAAAHLLLR